MDELLEARIANFNLLPVLLFFTSSEEVIERFTQTIGLILKHLRVNNFEPLIAPLDLRYLSSKIESSQALTSLLVCFLTLRKHEIIQFGTKMELRI